MLHLLTIKSRRRMQLKENSERMKYLHKITSEIYANHTFKHLRVFSGLESGQIIAITGIKLLLRGQKFSYNCFYICYYY